MKEYTPERSHIVWLHFSPQAGHEQTGFRPALVMSPKSYNQRTGLMLACPITSKVKGYPFEVAVEGKRVQGVVLSDQIKCLDWKARKAKFAEKATESVHREVQAKLLVLLQ